jgi:hypothetical protein
MGNNSYAPHSPFPIPSSPLPLFPYGHIFAFAVILTVLLINPGLESAYSG